MTRKCFTPLVMGLAMLGLVGCPPAGPRLTLNVDTLHFGVEGTTYETVKTVEVRNTGRAGSTLEFTVSSDEPWATATPASGSVAAGSSRTVTITIDRAYSEAKQSEFATATLLFGGNGGTESLAVTTAPDYYTEEFTAGNDLENTRLTFTPDNSINFYDLALDRNVTGFGTDPTGGRILNFGFGGGPVRAGLADGETVPFYGESYDTLYISPEGWVSFGEPGTGNSTLIDHFSVPQVSGLPVDADSSGSMVSYLQQDDRVVITYEDAPSDPPFKQDSLNNFQFEFFFNGDIRLTFLNMDDALNGVAGLSSGVGAQNGIPRDFLETNLNTQEIN